ncbi:tetratricopeptide (TPR) repeat protein [Sinorhizobium terangae]|uniref:Tetratricopeptide repeat protein n=1 Tax=Sinorhizobium terangae TaxID=110322 RepID=A0A6N7LEW1_SINTE|nr:tetratricopeptide repeat protein [Sinorhizobium terangae]MBB4189606.1 tetratricopeptide (TPR) repeat protein [Sinorhizobium terangae]MQX15758.1 tetratricopeptide repeat protein [Sinorhizobium terangae]
MDNIEKIIILKLIDEVKALDASDLELIGHNMVALLEGQNLIHHGLNKDHKPSGYTVDTFSQASDIVAEYSTEKKYFVNGAAAGEPPFYEKIENDVAHALSHAPSGVVKKIYLLTTEEEVPSFRSDFNQTPTFKKHGKLIEIYDAREIAKTIYRQSIKSPQAASFYCDAFPSFSQSLDNYEYYGKLPAQCKGYSPDSLISSALSAHFSTSKICVLNGLSGAGKTQAAINFVRERSKDFGNYIWINGADWPKDTSLAAVKRTRGGAPVNVAGLFNATKSILVIDGVDRTLDAEMFTELKPGFALGGLVLATSQVRGVGNSIYLEIPKISDSSALKILGEADVSNPVVTDFVAKCKFLPLILSTARSTIESQNLNKYDFYQDIVSNPIDVSSDGRSIIKAILSKLEQETYRALVKIADSGVFTHDAEFLRSFIGINRCANLQARSILLPGSGINILKVHDLLCYAVQENPCSAELAAAVTKRTLDAEGEMKPSLLREIHLSYEVLIEQHKSRLSKEPDWLTYALLQIDGERKQQVYPGLHEYALRADLPLAAIMSIIDAREVQSYKLKRLEREDYYRRCAEEYKSLIDAGVTTRIRAELLHHRGKALRRSEGYEEALRCFQELRDFSTEWHATLLQISHLGTQYGVSPEIRSAGSDAMNELVSLILSNSSAIPLRVSLSALAKLRTYKTLANAIRGRPEDVAKLHEIITTAALDGIDQFYEAFVSFTSLFGYEHETLAVALVEQIPELLAIEPKAIDAKQWTSACEGFANVSQGATRLAKADLATITSDASLRFADEILKKDRLKGFDARAIAKAYNNRGHFKKALEAIGKVAESDLTHWTLYRLAEAQKGDGQVDAALGTAERALKLATQDSAASDNLSSYYELVGRCYQDSENDALAIEHAEQAISTCRNNRYLGSLKTWRQSMS